MYLQYPFDVVLDVLVFGGRGLGRTLTDAGRGGNQGIGFATLDVICASSTVVAHQGL